MRQRITHQDKEYLVTSINGITSVFVSISRKGTKWMVYKPTSIEVNHTETILAKAS